jgi:AmmeMemoRadiSam system protein B
MIRSIGFWISLCLVSILLCGMVGSCPAAETALTGIRIPVDSVGYALRPGQIEHVIALSDSLEADLLSRYERFGEKGKMIGAIVPHDDHLYAGRIYVHAMRRIEAPLAVLVGVCHAGRRKGIEGKLIFDTHAAWVGPYGECGVSALREEIVGSLPPDLVMVSDELHGEEHSLEAFIPFLQYYRRDIEILPVLVTRMPSDLMGRASELFARALHDACETRGWRLGRDVVLLVSADCVHYGDEGWGGRNYAPFGVDDEGYRLAVEQDLSIAVECLTGSITDRNAADFRERVERDDLEWPYKVTWCGVYSIPFGIRALATMTDLVGRPRPVGHLLRYGTSIDPGRLPGGIEGLGVTNISTLRHWVGHVSIGYW